MAKVIQKLIPQNIQIEFCIFSKFEFALFTFLQFCSLHSHTFIHLHIFFNIHVLGDFYVYVI